MNAPEKCNLTSCPVNGGMVVLESDYTVFGGRIINAIETVLYAKDGTRTIVIEKTETDDDVQLKIHPRGVAIKKYSKQHKKNIFYIFDSTKKETVEVAETDDRQVTLKSWGSEMGEESSLVTEEYANSNSVSALTSTMLCKYLLDNPKKKRVLRAYAMPRGFNELVNSDHRMLTHPLGIVKIDRKEKLLIIDGKDDSSKDLPLYDFSKIEGDVYFRSHPNGITLFVRRKDGSHYINLIESPGKVTPIFDSKTDKEKFVTWWPYPNGILAHVGNQIIFIRKKGMMRT